jgi:peptide/nickel transport system substrate-binding protein
MNSASPKSARRHRRRTRPIVAVGAGALAVLLSACSGGGHSTAAATSGSAAAATSGSAAAATSGSSGAATSGSTADGTLKWAVTLPTHWDPVAGGAGGNFRILALVYASLTNIDAKGDPVPGLAQSWNYNSTGTEVTFHLRPNLKFSDGTPVNAVAVKDEIVRGQTQNTSALLQDLTPIKSVTTSGDSDVLVTLTHPDYQIPLLFGERVLQIASPTAAADPTKLDQAPVGAGPFIVTKLIPGQKVLLKKNPDYWDAKDIHIANVEVDAAPAAATVVAGLKTGVYNFATLDPSQASAAKAAGLDVFVQPGFNASDIGINVNKAPFKGDPTLVDALRYAINRQQFVDQLTFGYGVATDQPFPPGYIAYDPQSANLFPYNPTKAKQLLAQAGYQPHKLKLDLVDSTAAPSDEIIQSQLAAIGIDVTITVNKNWATPYFAKTLPFSVYGTTGRDSPTETLTAHFGPQGVLNLSSPYEPSGFDAAVAKAEATPIGSPDYAKNLQAATRAGLPSEALIFTYSSPNLFAKSKSISALPGNPGHVDWTGVTISSK